MEQPLRTIERTVELAYTASSGGIAGTAHHRSMNGLGIRDAGPPELIGVRQWLTDCEDNGCLTRSPATRHQDRLRARWDRFRSARFQEALDVPTDAEFRAPDCRSGLKGVNLKV